MSVKILSSDAQRLFAAKIAHLNEVFAKVQANAKTLRAQSLYAADSYLSSIRVELAGLEELRTACQQFLGAHDSWSISGEEPVPIVIVPEATKNFFPRAVYGKIFLFQNALYEVEEGYTSEEAEVLMLDYIKKKRRKVDYLMARKDIDDSAQDFERTPIPENVRHEVWRRDKGRCVTCGSVMNLEFDHLIPVSRGGSNTARNVQLLCQECNRRKSANL